MRHIQVMALAVLILSVNAWYLDDKAQAQPVEGLELKPINLTCGILLDKVVANGGRATIVTNNGRTQVVHYLTGSLSPNGSSASGELTELKSDRKECLERTGGEGSFSNCKLDQPFSMRQPDKAKLSITKQANNKGAATIVWPGGGVTTDELVCTASGTYIWHREHITAVLVISEGPRPPR